MVQQTQLEPVVYQGQFGDFTITDRDRQGVMVYRAALLVAAISFAVGALLSLTVGPSPALFTGLTVLYGIFWVAMGVSLFTIHIYLRVLHRTLQAFWLVGGLASVAIAFSYPEPLALAVYTHPLTILGVGFTFAALTGIYFKEAFCFNRFETKILTGLVPLLLLGHLTGLLPSTWEEILLGVWAGLFVVFAGRKVVQAIPPDIGDKSVFDYLEAQRKGQRSLNA